MQPPFDRRRGLLLGYALVGQRNRVHLQRQLPHPRRDLLRPAARAIDPHLNLQLVDPRQVVVQFGRVDLR